MKFLTLILTITLLSTSLTTSLNAQTICTKIIPEVILVHTQTIEIEPERTETICIQGTPDLYEWKFETVVLQKGYYKGTITNGVNCITWINPVTEQVRKKTLIQKGTPTTLKTIVTPAITRTVTVYDVQRDARLIETTCN